MNTYTISYDGDLRCTLVHDDSGQRLVTDAPKDNHGRGEAFSPTDLCCAALGACLTTVMGIHARKEGLRIEGTRLSVEKRMSTQPPRRIIGVAITLTMPPGVPRERRAFLEQAARTCPVALSLHPDIAQDVQFVWPD
jgi:uncharacterized OsmC-like protein